MGHVEDSLDVSKIYPHQPDTTVKTVGVDNITTNDGKETWCYFTDPDNQIDYSECVIADETMTVIFQSGMLTGKEFVTTYTHKGKKFLLRPVTENGYIYPDISDAGVVKPFPGDRYSVFHISMPQELVEQAEREALKEAVKYLYDNEQPKYTYDWQLDGIFAKRREGTWLGMLNPGYFVRFSDPQFLPDPVDIRITAVKDYVNKALSPEITLSNNISGKSLGGILNEIPAKQQEIERSKNEAISYTKRRWKDTQDLINGLAGMTDEFKETLLSSLAFEGLVFRAGVPSLQFNFLKEDWDTATSPAIRYWEGKLSVEGQSRIRHDVMTVDGRTPYWLVDALAPYGGMDKDKSYYLYIEASKDLEDVDGRMQGKATFRVTEEKIKLEDRDGYYTFWVAFVGSENDLEERSIRTMCGYTEILPGQITTDMLISRDGNSFLDFMNNRYALGNKDNGIDLNVTKDNQLTIRNASLEIKDQDENIVASIDGDTGAALFGKGAHLFNADGSGIMAKGNIMWDKEGKPIFNGTLTSIDEYGNKILIDAERHRIELYDWHGNTMGFWRYSVPDTEIEDVEDISSSIEVNHRVYHKDNMEGILAAYTRIGPSGVSTYRMKDDGSYYGAWLDVDGVHLYR